MSRRNLSPNELFDAACAGDRAALARVLSLLERGDAVAREVGRLAYKKSGNGYTVGITGAPGAGKSTLTSSLIKHLRQQQLEIAVLAIDPSSPFTGGAILGDRVRMQDHATDPGVFIRSMATRGHLGGLSLSTPEAIRMLDAVGRAWILVETVGVGQVEVEIAGKADTTVVVLNPGWGDSVQANKAGLMEIADIFVINKADRKGVEETRRDIEQMLELSDLPHEAWRPPIIATIGNTGEGVPALWDAVLEHGSSVSPCEGISQTPKHPHTWVQWHRAKWRDQARLCPRRWRPSGATNVLPWGAMPHRRGPPANG